MNMPIREDLLPQPGTVIASQYRIDSLLGHGGMGAVFAGGHLRTGRAVAIKWMLPQAAASVDSLKRFIAEAQVTARIEHPNVVHIYDFGEDEGSPYLVMERLRGESLRERLDREGRLGAEAAVRLIVPAMRGVAEAHREGIIHRDLKPDNIFLCQGKDGSEREAKVVDFGISKLREGAGGSNLTGTGMMMGTPSYMSPEQLNAPKEADKRFDVYALGVVLYEAICGRCPYEAEGIFQLVGQIMSSEPTPPSQLAPELSPALESVVLRAFHRDANQRYPDVPSLITAVEQAASGQMAAPVGNLGAGDGAKPMTPMTPMQPVPSTVPLGEQPRLPASHLTPPPSATPHPTAVLYQTPMHGSQPGYPGSQPGVHPGSYPGVPAGTQPGFHAGHPASQPGFHPGSAPGVIPAGTPYGGTPYVPHPPPRKGGGGAKWLGIGFVALLLGCGSAGGVWFFLMGPGADRDDPVTPVAAHQPTPGVEPVTDIAPTGIAPTDIAATNVGATDPSGTGATDIPVGEPVPQIDPPTVVDRPEPPTTTVHGSSVEDPVVEPVGEPVEPEPLVEPEPEPEPVVVHRPRPHPRPRPPTPRPVIRPVAPPVVSRPPPRPTGGRGTNGAMIIQ